METKKEIVKEVEVKKITKKKPDRMGEAVNCVMLNIRAKASLETEVLEVIGCGTEVKILSSSGEFFRVETPNGTVGYTMKQYISPIVNLVEA